MVKIELDSADTMSDGSCSWENEEGKKSKEKTGNTKTWGVKNMQVWQEVRFPTVSNSILQTVRKHAAALQALGKCVENVCAFCTPHWLLSFFFLTWNPQRCDHFLFASFWVKKDSKKDIIIIVIINVVVVVVLYFFLYHKEINLNRKKGKPNKNKRSSFLKMCL